MLSPILEVEVCITADIACASSNVMEKMNVKSFKECLSNLIYIYLKLQVSRSCMHASERYHNTDGVLFIHFRSFNKGAFCNIGNRTEDQEKMKGG